MSNNNAGISKKVAISRARGSWLPKGTPDQTVVESGASRARRTLVGRNDPCPCGSLLKWKKCHGRPKPFPSTRGKRRPIASSVSLVEIDDEVT